MFSVTDFPDLPDAQCRDVDPEAMTPDLDDVPEHLASMVRDEAVSVCSGCPELVRCSAWADSEAYPYGAWGGRWWDGAPTDVAIPEAPIPHRTLRSSSRERVA